MKMMIQIHDQRGAIERLTDNTQSVKGNLQLRTRIPSHF